MRAALHVEFFDRSRYLRRYPRLLDWIHNGVGRNLLADRRRQDRSDVDGDLRCRFGFLLLLGTASGKQ